MHVLVRVVMAQYIGRWKYAKTMELYIERIQALFAATRLMACIGMRRGRRRQAVPRSRGHFLVHRPQP